MGLTERRRIAAITEELASASTLLKEAIDMDISLEFDIATLPEDAAVLDSYDYYKDYGVPMIIRIFKDLTKDNLGKQAVKEKIEAIKLINTSKDGEDPGEKSFSLENKLLLVKYGFYKYGDKLWSEEELRTKIENML